jgi:hypothetical protein
MIRKKELNSSRERCKGGVRKCYVCDIVTRSGVPLYEMHQRYGAISAQYFDTPTELRPGRTITSGNETKMKMVRQIGRSDFQTTESNEPYARVVTQTREQLLDQIRQKHGTKFNRNFISTKIVNKLELNINWRNMIREKRSIPMKLRVQSPRLQAIMQDLLLLPFLDWGGGFTTNS